MKHIPVLTNEVIALLQPKKNENFIDATLGHGGHAKLILEKTAPDGLLLGIEQDREMIPEAMKTLKNNRDRVTVFHDNFIQLGLLIRKWPVKKIDGILIDLGPSTPQLTEKGRGFSFRADDELDMRMDQTRTKLTAVDVVNKFSEKELIDIFHRGEEPFAKSIARHIIDYRKQEPIRRASQLVDIIKKAMPPAYRINKKTHFATNAFRSLRMEVNDEINNLNQVLPQAASALSEGGRIAVITFHSIEDRIVKNFLRDREDLKLITKKPLTASEEELKSNASSRSAKARGAIKTGGEVAYHSIEQLGKRI